MVRRGAVSAMLLLFAPVAVAGQAGEGGSGAFQVGLQAGRVSHSLLGTADGTLTRADADDLMLDVDIRAEPSVTVGGFLARRITSTVALRVRAARTTTHMRIEALARPESGPGAQAFDFDGLGDVGLWLTGAELVWTPLATSTGPRPHLVAGAGVSRWTITGLDDLDFPPLLESPVNFDPVKTTLPAFALGGGVSLPLGERGSMMFEIADFVSGNPFEDDDFRIGTDFQGLGRAEDLVHSLTLSAALRLAF